MKASNHTITQFDKWIDDHAGQIAAEIQAFSRIRSVSRGDLAVPRAPFGPEMREMLDFALMRGASYGFDTQNHEGYCGSISMGNVNHAIGIFGHLDVVPEGDGWTYPPFEATRVGDFLFGRGVADNKGPCVMGLMLMLMFKELGINLRHGLRLVLGCGEETGMQDMDYFAHTQIMPEVSLVPDMRFPVNYAQKGMLRAKVSIDMGDDALITFSGGEAPNMVPPHASAGLGVGLEDAVGAFKRAGLNEREFEFVPTLEGVQIKAAGVASHAAYPEAGKSAIRALADALVAAGLLDGGALEAVRAIVDLSSDHYGRQVGLDCEDPETGKTTMVVGTACTRERKIQLSVDCRLSIAADLEQVEKRFRGYCERMGFEIDGIEIGKPFYIAVDDPRVTALMDVYRELTGDDASAYTAGGGTYSRCLRDAITFGPGFPEEMPRPKGLPANHGGVHAPDEYIHLPTALRAMKIYAAAILELDQII